MSVSSVFRSQIVLPERVVVAVNVKLAPTASGLLASMTITAETEKPVATKYANTHMTIALI